MGGDRPSVAPDFCCYRLTLVRESSSHFPARCSTPEEAVTLLGQLLAGEPGEVMGAIYFDTHCQAIGYAIPYRGGLSRCTVEPRGLLAPALLANAASLVLFHCHPSGCPTPSTDDIAFTRRMVQAAEILGLFILDHLVYGSGGRWASVGVRGGARGLALAPILPFTPRDPTVHELRPSQKADGRKTVKPKYRDPENPENTWAGRGCHPAWLRRRLAAGGRLEDFLIAGKMKQGREKPGESEADSKQGGDTDG
jgi:DNA repair protein RadC